MTFTRDADPVSYPIVFTKQYGAFVSAARFFQQQQIDPGEHVGRYAYEVAHGADIGIPEVSGSVCLVDLRRRLR